MMVSVEDILKRYYMLSEKKMSLEKEIEAIEIEINQIEGAIAVLAEDHRDDVPESQE